MAFALFLRPIGFFALVFAFLAGPAYPVDCKEIFKKVARSYPHGHSFYIDAVAADARDVANKIISHYPHLNPSALAKILEFALENAAGHGSTGKGSLATFEAVEEVDRGIRVRITNFKVSNLPPTLTNRVFTPDDAGQSVPQSERHKEGGVRGIGLTSMLESLKLVAPATQYQNEPPTMEWKEVAEGGRLPKIEFVLFLPKSTRVLNSR